jgi:hypothetical protein
LHIFSPSCGTAPSSSLFTLTSVITASDDVTGVGLGLLFLARLTLKALKMVLDVWQLATKDTGRTIGTTDKDAAEEGSGGSCFTSPTSKRTLRSGIFNYRNYCHCLMEEVNEALDDVSIASF